MEAGVKLFIGKAGTPVTEDDGECGHGAREVAGGHACDSEGILGSSRGARGHRTTRDMKMAMKELCSARWTRRSRGRAPVRAQGVSKARLWRVQHARGESLRGQPCPRCSPSTGDHRCAVGRSKGALW